MIDHSDIYESLGYRWLEERGSPQHAKSIIDLIKSKVTKRDRILDACCGYGRLTLPLYQMGYNIRGFDVSRTLIDEAQSRIKSTLKNSLTNIYAVSDMRSLPYCDNTFDFLFCVWASFNYMANEEDQLKAISEFSRVISSGGMFLIEMPYHDDEKPTVKNIKVNNVSYPYYPQTPASMYSILQKSNLTSSEIYLFDIAGKKELSQKLTL